MRLPMHMIIVFVRLFANRNANPSARTAFRNDWRNGRLGTLFVVSSRWLEGTPKQRLVRSPVPMRALLAEKHGAVMLQHARRSPPGAVISHARTTSVPARKSCKPRFCLVHPTMRNPRPSVSVETIFPR
jgi:hypothetical protein